MGCVCIVYVYKKVREVNKSMMDCRLCWLRCVVWGVCEFFFLSLARFFSFYSQAHLLSKDVRQIMNDCSALSGY